jgi:hypothetical protein
MVKNLKMASDCEVLLGFGPCRSDTSFTPYFEEILLFFSAESQEVSSQG